MLCNYSAETEKILLHDLFLFRLEDESFMSKIISEENPEITNAQLQHELKYMEAGPATAKYIKGAKGPEQKTIHQIHGKKGKMQFCQKRQRPHKDPKHGQQQGQQFYGKRKQPFHKGLTPAAKKAKHGNNSKSTIKLEAN